MENYLGNYQKDVFINCPFDDDYTHLLNAIVFSVHDIGFRPRCARETSNAGQVRLDKIFNIISQCKYSIHDISRTELDRESGLPRFNMPFELGLDLGCKKFGNSDLQEKVSLIMDVEKFRYQKFISDISGQDIFGHNNSEEQIIKIVRDWLDLEVDTKFIVPSGEKIYKRYIDFKAVLPDVCRKLNWNSRNLSFKNYSYVVATWISTNTI